MCPLFRGSTVYTCIVKYTWGWIILSIIERLSSFGGKNVLPLYKLVHRKVSFVQRCPYSRVSSIRGSTVSRLFGFCRHSLSDPRESHRAPQNHTSYNPRHFTPSRYDRPHGTHMHTCTCTYTIKFSRLTYVSITHQFLYLPIFSKPSGYSGTPLIWTLLGQKKVS